jgi:hypothetical protein
MSGSGSAEMTANVMAVDGSDWDSEPAVHDSGEGDQVFLVLRPLRLRLGLKIGWHYSRQELLDRIPTSAIDARAGRIQLEAFLNDPLHEYLRPVAGGWGWPSPRDAPDPFARSGELLLSMMLVLVHADWRAHSQYMAEHGHGSEDEPQGSLGGMTCAEANALRRLAESVVERTTERARLLGLEVRDDMRLALRRACLEVVQALQEDLTDSAFARRSRQDELWR